MPADMYPAPEQDLSADRAGENQRGSQPAAEMPAAADVVKPAVPHKGRVICVPRAGQARDFVVILRTGVPVFYNHRERGASGTAV